MGFRKFLKLRHRITNKSLWGCIRKKKSSESKRWSYLPCLCLLSKGNNLLLVKRQKDKVLKRASSDKIISVKENESDRLQSLVPLHFQKTSWSLCQLTTTDDSAGKPHKVGLFNPAAAASHSATHLHPTLFHSLSDDLYSVLCWAFVAVLPALCFTLMHM